MAKKRITKTAETRANAGAGAAPPSRVRVKLATIDDVKVELARLYRQAKGRQIAIADASRLGNLLALLGRLMEGADLEKRIEELEAEAEKQRRHNEGRR